MAWNSTTTALKLVRFFIVVVVVEHYIHAVHNSLIKLWLSKEHYILVVQNSLITELFPFCAQHRNKIYKKWCGKQCNVDQVYIWKVVHYLGRYLPFPAIFFMLSHQFIFVFPWDLQLQTFENIVKSITRWIQYSDKSLTNEKCRNLTSCHCNFRANKN